MTSTLFSATPGTSNTTGGAKAVTAPAPPSCLYSFAATTALLLFALCIAVALKHHYSFADSDDLAWILKPTAFLVSILTGLPFECETGTGYINRIHKLVIAPSCAGVNFFIIAFCMSIFSFLSRFPSVRGKLFWVIASFFAGYVLTLTANTLRISIAAFAYEVDLFTAWISAAQAHRIIGIAVYFSFLIGYYDLLMRTAAWLAAGRAGDRCAFRRGSALGFSTPWLMPLGWYVLISVIVPFMNSAAAKTGAGFRQHCLTIVGICCIILVVAGLIRRGCAVAKRTRLIP